MTLPAQNFVDNNFPVVSAEWLNEVDTQRLALPGQLAAVAALTPALAADLASTDSGEGADLVGLHLAGAGEESILAAPFLNLLVKGLKRNFGCVGDGSANDYAKMANAMQATGKIVEVEDGTFLYNTALPAPTCSAIIGQGDTISIFKPGAGVTKGLSIGDTNYPRILQRFQILGTLTPTATGLYLGDAASIAMMLYNVRCKGFSGAGGIGARLGDVLKSQLIGLTVESNETGLLVQKSSVGFPTTTRFETLVATNNSKKGCKIIDGSLIQFVNCDFESSGEEGFFADSSSGTTIVDLLLEACWFEDNYGNSNTQYHARFGTNSGAGTIRAGVHDCYFDTNSGGTAAKAVIFDGPETAAFSLFSPRLSSGYANAIRLQNGAYGVIDSWLPYMSYNTTVSDPSANDLGAFGASKAYTPTVAGATWSVGPTITLAQYKALGRWVDIDFRIDGTTTNTPTAITLTMPAGLTIQNSAYFGGAIQVNSVNIASSLIANQPDNLLYIGKADASAMAAGAMILKGTIRVEIA